MGGAFAREERAPPLAGAELASAGSAPPKPIIAYDKAAQIRYACDETPCVGVDRQQLQEDLKNTIVWSGRFWTDYCFYVANWHGLLGIFLSHPEHPFSKSSRIATTFISSSLMILGLALNCGEESLWAVTIFITLFDIIYGQYLFTVASMQSVLCCGPCRQWCFARLLTCYCKFMALFTGVMMGFCWLMIAMFWALVIRGCDGEAIISSFLSSRMRSYAIWFPMMMFLPCCGYWIRWSREYAEYRAATQQNAAQAATHGLHHAGAFQRAVDQQGLPLTALPYSQPFMQQHNPQPGYGGPSSGQALYTPSPQIQMQNGFG